MTHPYPPRHPRLPYCGKYHYFLTFCAADRQRVFAHPDAVELVLQQFSRAASECRFELFAYCFLPDHVHLPVRGLEESSDCRTFIRAAKQYAGYYYRRRWGRLLWQRYGFERMPRDDAEVAFIIGYIIANPVRAGLVRLPAEYAHVGSQRYSMSEMLEICEYERREPEFVGARLPDRASSG